MRASVSPSRLQMTPGIPSQVDITITNPGTIIGGYTIRLLGVDPEWVDLPDDSISLFPDESRTVTAWITIPVGLVAGERRMAVQLREETPPFGSSVEEIVLVVPEAPHLQARVDPIVVTAGRRGRFSLLLDNTGNTPMSGHLTADDAEAKLTYVFDPKTLELAPGEHRVVDLQVKGKRPLLGTPLVRLINVHLRDGAAPPKPAKAPRDLRIGRPRAVPVAAATDPDQLPLANATLIQKARFARGVMSLVGLLAAITVFAIVITVSLSRIVGQSAQDRDLALQIASAEQGGSGATASASIRGSLTRLLGGAPLKAVEVSLYAADDPTTPLTKSVSDGKGVYRFQDLEPGDYKLYFSGSGLQQQWYPDVLVPDDAEAVTVEEGKLVVVPGATLSGTPATISGTVVGDDVADATVTLRSTALPPESGELSEYAATATSPVGSDGAFALANVPSPADYIVEVTKTGYATSQQPVRVEAGEALTDVKINLVTGNGIIEGDVVSSGRPITGATVTLTSGDVSIATISGSGSGAEPGGFTVDHLPTPASYTLTVALDGFTSQTMTLSLLDGQHQRGVSIDLVKSSGCLTGNTLLTVADTVVPTGGVTVMVSDGEKVVQTASRSAGSLAGQSATAAGGGSSCAADVGAGTTTDTSAPDTSSTGDRVGSWAVSGLTLPGTYTVSFARPDLEAQTISIALDANGQPTEGSLGVVTSDEGIVTVMRSATAEITGLVTQTDNIKNGVYPGIGEVQVTLTSGATTYATTTASAEPYAGQFHLGKILEGTYTLTFTRAGVRPQSQIVELVPGQTFNVDPVLAAGAVIGGQVVDEDDDPVRERFYVALYRLDDYGTTVYRSMVTEDGSYEFSDVDAPETYIIEVSRSATSAPLGTHRTSIKPSRSKPDEDVRIRTDG